LSGNGKQEIQCDPVTQVGCTFQKICQHLVQTLGADVLDPAIAQA